MKPYRLSKSKIISGLQCVKRLYLEIHQPELREDSAYTESLFTTGHRVGEVAQELVPDGVMIEMDHGLGNAIRETTRYLESVPAPPLFEATFSYDNVLVRTDLFFQEENGYRLVEVKASTSVKDYHLNDCAVQAWVIEGCGFPLGRVELAHIDTSFIYPGENRYDGLFYHADVAEQVNQIKMEVPRWVHQFQKMLMGGMPDIDVGPHCSDPFECPFVNHCWPPESDYPVQILPYGGKVVEELLAQGIKDVRDIPAGYLTNSKHERVRQASVSGKPFVSSKIKSYLKSLPYPRYYLDFETIGAAVPVWEGTRPYQAHLPFQWSLHKETKPADLSHKEFLDLTGANPMRPLAVALIEALEEKGPIIVYSHFERSVLRQLGSFFPELESDMNALIERLENLLYLMQENYYHPDMMGSWSIKAVLPTVAPDLNYNDLEEIQDGGGAQEAYNMAISLPDDSERKKLLRHNMLKYCELDTLAMVRLVDFF